ncbi:MAG: hypothetical protein COA99_19550 [Moraxellaceae bacterium]|nr:MAG: hypothetical protein COA99_19550 [Moraxellaceae bacterium]
MNKKNQILLSIVIPTYERPHVLNSTLECLLNQIEYINNEIEIIVVDNGSKTYNILEIFSSKKFERFNFFRNEENLGIDGNVKKCIEYSNGNFVWLLSDDDLLYPNSVKKIMNSLKQNLDRGLFVLNYDVYDEKCENIIYRNIVNKDLNDDSTVISQLTFISINIINKSLLDEKVDLNSFDKYLGTLYYHMSISIYLAAASGYIFINTPFVKFRSSCSNLGGTLESALRPYLVFKEINNSKLSYRNDTFVKNNVLLYVKSKKLNNSLSKYDVISIIKLFGVTPKIMYILIIYLCPSFICSLFIKARNLFTKFKVSGLTKRK